MSKSAIVLVHHNSKEHLLANAEFHECMEFVLVHEWREWGLVNSDKLVDSIAHDEWHKTIG